MGPPRTQPPLGQWPEQCPPAGSCPGAHGAPCPSPLGAPGPFPVQGSCSGLCRALSVPGAPLAAAVLRQLGWLHPLPCLGKQQSWKGNSAWSHPGAAGSCILGNRGRKPPTTQQVSSRGVQLQFVCVSPCWGGNIGVLQPLWKALQAGKAVSLSHCTLKRKSIPMHPSWVRH